MENYQANESVKVDSDAKMPHWETDTISLLLLLWFLNTCVWLFFHTGTDQ